MTPHSAEFLDCYFREIGVYTPLPTAFQSAKEADANSDAREAVSTAKTTTTLSEHPKQPEPAPQPQVETPPVVAEKTMDIPLSPLPVITEVHADSLQALQAQVADCQRCALAKSRRQTVFGVGDPEAKLVFIGEAPGADEDRLGEPFVGRAGQLLNRMLAAIGLERRDVYIMNTLKCRPPWNRDPEPQEKAACLPWFEAQLRLLKPVHICLLGKVAAQHLLHSEASLATLREQRHEYQGIPVTVTYHPAYLLRNSPHKRRAWEDFQRMMESIRKPAEGKDG